MELSCGRISWEGNARGSSGRSVEGSQLFLWWLCAPRVCQFVDQSWKKASDSSRRNFPGCHFKGNLGRALARAQCPPVFGQWVGTDGAGAKLLTGLGPMDSFFLLQMNSKLDVHMYKPDIGTAEYLLEATRLMTLRGCCFLGTRTQCSAVHSNFWVSTEITWRFLEAVGNDQIGEVGSYQKSISGKPPFISGLVEGPWMLQCIFSWEPIALRLRWFLRQLVKAIKAVQFFLVVIEWVHSSEIPQLFKQEKKQTLLSSALVLKPSHVVVVCFLQFFLRKFCKRA